MESANPMQISFNSPESEFEPWYASLLGMANYFYKQDPPNLKFCVQCLQAVFNFKPSTEILARTHLQIGKVLFGTEKNSDLSLFHLERAVSPLDIIQFFILFFYRNVGFNANCTLL